MFEGLADLPERHDLAHLMVALRSVRRFGIALDGGAHRGIWTRELCDRFRRVLAFEPTLLANRIDSRAEVHRQALGAVHGLCSMAAGTENTGQTHVVPGNDVKVVTIDSLKLPGLDFLKLDVEGFEYFALIGGEATISRHRPVVLIEENGLCQRYGTEPGAAGALLESWGARLQVVCNKDYIYAW